MLPQTEMNYANTLWRIDKDETVYVITQHPMSNTKTRSTFQTQRLNLARMCLNSHTRKLIIDLEPPRFFHATPEAFPATPEWGGLNENQIEAGERVFAAQDYFLIGGMPGTGKSTTIAHISKHLVSNHLLTLFSKKFS